MAKEILYFKLNPHPVEVVISTPAVLNIETNAEEWSYRIVDNTKCEFDKDSLTLTGLAEGKGTIIFTYTRGEESREFNYIFDVVTTATNTFFMPNKFFLGEALTSIDVGKSVTLQKGTEAYNDNAVVTITSSNPNVVKIVKSDDNMEWEFIGEDVGEAEITINAYKTIEAQGSTQKIDVTEYNESWLIEVVAWEKDLLEVSPQLSILLQGDRQKLYFKTNYENIEITSSNPDVIGVEKQILVGKKLGSSIIGIKGSSRDKLPSFVSFETIVANDLPTEEASDKTTFDYDDDLPLNLSDGAIVYKTGKFENSPVIEYKFNGQTKKYSCIGLKFLKYTDEGEPHSIAFMSEEGSIDDTMYKYKQKLLELGVEEVLYDKIKETIHADMRDYLANTSFAIGNTHITEKPIPKWVGLMIDGYNGNIRRLNTMGLEEGWELHTYNASYPMNQLSNTDPITQLFNQVEPYKSFKRCAILHEDLRTGKYAHLRRRIHYNCPEVKSMIEEGYKIADNFALSASYYPDLHNYDFYNVLKKSYYIDVGVKWKGRYFLVKCIGGEPFKIDMADYCQGMDRDNPGMELYYWKLADYRSGIFQYKVEGSVIHANLHPCFYDFFDAGNVVYSEEYINSFKGDRTYPDRDTNPNDQTSITLDYRYYGCFPYNSNDDMTWLRPRYKARNANFSSYLTLKSKSYEFGELPSIGINTKHVNMHEMHLIHLMIEIEEAVNYRNLGIRTKFYINNTSRSGQVFNYSGTTNMCVTLQMGNNTNCYENRVLNYRGAEGFYGAYNRVFGIWNNLNSRDAKMMIPHSHCTRMFEDKFITIPFITNTGSVLGDRFIPGSIVQRDENRNSLHASTKYVSFYNDNTILYFGLLYGDGLCVGRAGVSHAAGYDWSRSSI